MSGQLVGRVRVGGLDVATLSRQGSQTGILERSCTTDLLEHFAQAAAANSLNFFHVTGVEIGGSFTVGRRPAYPTHADLSQGVLFQEDAGSVLDRIDTVLPESGMGKPLEQQFRAPDGDWVAA